MPFFIEAKSQNITNILVQIKNPDRTCMTIIIATIEKTVEFEVINNV